MVAVGQPCSFYHEGGHGLSRWIRGWRYGIVRALPIKGRRKGWAQIEIPVKRWKMEETGMGYVRLAFERVWVSRYNVNAPGDTTYHPPTLVPTPTPKASKTPKIRKTRKRP